MLPSRKRSTPNEVFILSATDVRAIPAVLINVKAKTKACDPIAKLGANLLTGMHVSPHLHEGIAITYN